MKDILQPPVQMAHRNISSNLIDQFVSKSQTFNAYLLVLLLVLNWSL